MNEIAELKSLKYAVNQPAVPGQWMMPSKYTIDTTVEKLREAIKVRNLFLVTEIDTQIILRRIGLEIQPTRQLLFFHPRYMRRLLQLDARSIQEVPLKIVVVTDEAGSVLMLGPDMEVVFQRYVKMQQFGEELALLCGEIAATAT